MPGRCDCAAKTSKEQKTQCSVSRECVIAPRNCRGGDHGRVGPSTIGSGAPGQSSHGSFSAGAVGFLSVTRLLDLQCLEGSSSGTGTKGPPGGGWPWTVE